MSQPDGPESGRKAALLFEQSLPVEKRKRLGQFFSGVQLGKVLGHLAISPQTRTVLDPMAGHGDLLDAVVEVAREQNIPLERIEGIEIDGDTATVARRRLKLICAGTATPDHRLIHGNAFDATTLKQLPRDGYDLVITNPPYVRYQALNGSDNGPDSTRAALLSAIEHRLKGDERDVWQKLASGYSGLADLSVPSWILSGLLVKPGGRLALVVPSTWRTRDYGDVIRYLMLRSFAVERIVQDTQPGWFSDALVRTELIIARRLTAAEAEQQLTRRTEWPTVASLTIAPAAANPASLVGNAFPGLMPEAKLAALIHDAGKNIPEAITIKPVNLQDEWHSMRGRAKPKPWLTQLEGALSASFESAVPSAVVPEAFQAILGGALKLSSLVPLERQGISVGQGLRTGCNRFFYVDALDASRNGWLRVKASEAFGRTEFEVPDNAVRPVLRKQSELSLVERRELPVGRVLDLRNWALPEDMDVVGEAAATYRARGEKVPQAMPESLAKFVRQAAVTPLEEGSARLAPQLSAVRTNMRAHREGVATPRFWYMLPDFMPRHLPAAFVGRVNNGTPWVECNLEKPILIDANFSTFWSADQSWSSFALKAMLNSAWCRLFMEALGTPLGGGALKLEAAHLRQLLIPVTSIEVRLHLHRLGNNLMQLSSGTLQEIDALVFGALSAEYGSKRAQSMTETMMERANTLRRMRRRAAA